MIAIIILLTTLASLFLGYLIHKFSYWQRKGVKTVRNNFLLGNLLNINSLHHSDIIQDLYSSYKGKQKVAGFYVYTNPIGVVVDLDLVKSVLISDFNSFIDRTDYKNNEDILAGNLANLEGAKWRPLRQKLSTCFSSAKMRYMFPTIKSVVQELELTCNNDLEKSSILNITDLVARFTTDIIGTCAFGMECNSLKDPLNKNRQITARAFGSTDFNIKWHLFQESYIKVMRFLGFKKFPQAIEDFFLKVLKSNVVERERLGIRRNDFVDVLIDLKNTKDENGNPSLTYNEIAAQMFIFFFAGFETSALVMGYALYELAAHPEIQERARKEIVDKLKEHNNEITYESIMEMPYLEQIITETLRLHPTIGRLQRVAVEDYKIPESDIVLDKGSTLYIPIKAIHHDPEIYDNPTEFRPERFHPSEKCKRHPQSFLGFGDGPRNCIGLKFGRMQTIIGLASMISKYKFSKCEKTVDKFEYSRHTFVLKPLNDVWLKMEKN